MASKPSSSDTVVDAGKRDFISMTASTLTIAGAACAAWPLLDSLRPAADVRAMASTEVDISNIPVGEGLTVMWRGKPVFIKHRTAQEIAEAEAANLAELPDPQADKDRVKKPEWLVLVGICTHLGCVPTGQKSTEARGDYKGWFCPCHGSQYDTSGRIRKGPAPTNMPVPPYTFINDKTIRIG